MWKIYELANRFAHITPDMRYTQHSGSLQSAKAKASREQVFQLTALVITNGAGEEVARKEWGKSWVTLEY